MKRDFRESADVVILDTSALLYWTHGDPLDRWITALVMRHKAPLITSDRTIRDYYDMSVW